MFTGVLGTQVLPPPAPLTQQLFVHCTISSAARDDLRRNLRQCLLSYIFLPTVASFRENLQLDVSEHTVV